LPKNSRLEVLIITTYALSLSEPNYTISKSTIADFPGAISRLYVRLLILARHSFLDTLVRSCVSRYISNQGVLNELVCRFPERSLAFPGSVGVVSMFHVSERLPNAPNGLLMVVDHIPSCTQTLPAQVRCIQINRGSNIVRWIVGGCDSATERMNNLIPRGKPGSTTRVAKISPRNVTIEYREGNSRDDTNLLPCAAFQSCCCSLVSFSQPCLAFPPRRTTNNCRGNQRTHSPVTGTSESYGQAISQGKLGASPGSKRRIWCRLHKLSVHLDDWISWRFHNDTRRLSSSIRIRG
jgi:hypothetical protein